MSIYLQLDSNDVILPINQYYGWKCRCFCLLNGDALILYKWNKCANEIVAEYNDKYHIRSPNRKKKCYNRLIMSVARKNMQ